MSLSRILKRDDNLLPLGLCLAMWRALVFSWFCLFLLLLRLFDSVLIVWQEGGCLSLMDPH